MHARRLFQFVCLSDNFGVRYPTLLASFTTNFAVNRLLCLVSTDLLLQVTVSVPNLNSLYCDAFSVSENKTCKWKWT